MKIIFLGTPHYGAIVLKKLIESKHQVVAVVCQPDKPVGRKQILTSPETKIIAQQNNIPVYQFKKIRIDGVETLKKIEADIMVTAAYGQILSQEILDITKYGVFNVHASLLPKYRGSSPIQWSLINGEKEIGATILKTLAGLDNGPILLKESIPILPEDTVESLMEKIGILGGNLLLSGLDMLESGNYTLTPQDEAQMTYFPMLKKENSAINFSLEGKEICNFVKGMAEWPVATINIYGNITKVFEAQEICYMPEKEYQIGQVVCVSNKQGLIVKCKNGFVRLTQIQYPNSKKMKDIEFLNGKKIEIGLDVTNKIVQKE